jgi:hypothetical protein
VSADHPEIFDPVALRHYRAGADLASAVLRTPRGWLNRVYWLLVGMSVAALLFIGLGSIDEYATGPAVVRLIGQTALAADAPGTIRSVSVHQGQQVDEGQTLAELDAVTQGALERRILRSPRAGTVGAVRVRAGQPVSAGEVAVVLAPASPRFHLIMALPGPYRPMLRPGLGVRLELLGFRNAYQGVGLESVADEVVGPGEAQRLLGAGDAAALKGPAVLAEASLPSDGFEEEGHLYKYYDGMQAISRVRVRTTRILVLLLPWVRGFLGP